MIGDSWYLRIPVKPIAKSKTFTRLMLLSVMIGAFILVVGFHVHILWILFGAGLIGLITTLKEGDSV